METRECQNCKNKFIIEPDDFSFYEKIKVPAPTFCPECRLIRRLLFQNAWDIRWCNCDKCGEKIISKHAPSPEVKVYCQKCWWADDWDGTEYSMEYDPAKPFLEQVKELTDKTPYVAVSNEYTSNVNCNYVNGIAWSKDCYLTFWADYCENVYYSSLLNTLKHSADCLRGYFSELCYQSVGFSRCYRMFFSEECDDCVDVLFCRNCYNCTNCVGCANLHGGSNCIFNVKYGKKEYEEKLKELNMESCTSLKNLEEKARKFWLTQPYRAYHGHSLNFNVTGDYVYTSKNSKECYVLNGAENCKWCQFITVSPIKDCYDYTGWGNNASLIHDSVTVGENASSIFFSNECWPDVLDLQYCIWNTACKNNFGCVNLKRKQHCILNKEYNKEEYKKLKEKIIEDMKVHPYVDRLGRKFFYGEFFSVEFSKFTYNKSNAMRFFPKTREEAIKEGYGWDDTETPVGKSTMKASSLPETIKETNVSILKEAIECMSCSRPYNIASGELDLLRKFELPIPHECPKCRENKRIASLTKPKLYDCECKKCGKQVKTPYAPERPEIIYCEKCYQQEVF
jgi:hypothetical protein